MPKKIVAKISCGSFIHWTIPLYWYITRPIIFEIIVTKQEKKGSRLANANQVVQKNYNRF
jgi:hypothetical protein